VIADGGKLRLPHALMGTIVFRFDAVLDGDANANSG
jgi:hypothetical protein